MLVHQVRATRERCVRQSRCGIGLLLFLGLLRLSCENIIVCNVCHVLSAQRVQRAGMFLLLLSISLFGKSRKPSNPYDFPLRRAVCRLYLLVECALGTVVYLGSTAPKARLPQGRKIKLNELHTAISGFLHEEQPKVVDRCCPLQALECPRQ